YPVVGGLLADVGLGLREVRVGGGREAEVLGDAPAQIARAFGRAAIVVPRRGGGAVHFGGELRCEVEHQATPQVAEADQATRLNEKARVGADRGRPGLLVPRVLYGAQDLNPPILWVGALIAETLEGNPHLHLVASIGHVAARFVHVVGVQVDRRVEPATRTRPPGGAGGDA